MRTKIFTTQISHQSGYHMKNGKQNISMAETNIDGKQCIWQENKAKKKKHLNPRTISK